MLPSFSFVSFAAAVAYLNTPRRSTTMSPSSCHPANRNTTLGREVPAELFACTHNLILGAFPCGTRTSALSDVEQIRQFRHLEQVRRHAGCQCCCTLPSTVSVVKPALRCVASRPPLETARMGHGRLTGDHRERRHRLACVVHIASGRDCETTTKPGNRSVPPPTLTKARTHSLANAHV